MMRLVNEAGHPVQLGLFDEKDLAEVVENDQRYILCHNPLRKYEDAATRLRLLEKTQAKLQSIADNVRDGRLKVKDKIARRLYRWLNHWNMERFFEVSYEEGKFEFSRKEDEIKRYEVLDGCYVIKTDVCRESMDKQEVVNRYRSLAKVEQAFRAMKSDDLMMRPIRHWNAKRVEGHVFMCMLAYLVTWQTRNLLADMFKRDQQTRECEADSLREIWETLREIKLGSIDADGSRIIDISHMNAKQKKILKFLNAQFRTKDRDCLGLGRQEKRTLEN